MILGIRRSGDERLRFIDWTGDASPAAGSQLLLNDGTTAMVVITADQLHGATPTLEEHRQVSIAPVSDARSALASIESERYDELLSALPDLGSMVSTPHGRGLVISRDVRHRTVAVRLDDTGETVTDAVEGGK